jgi:ABC-type transport system involved in multi-copper enzyme maturation permease subunit
MLNTGHIDVPFLLLSAAIIVLCMAAAYWAYNKRDLYI